MAARISIASERTMRRGAAALLLASVIAVAASSEEVSAKDVRSELRVRVGEKAPDFVLTAGDGKKIKLSDFAGRIVLLDFYRAHW